MHQCAVVSSTGVDGQASCRHARHAWCPHTRSHAHAMRRDEYLAMTILQMTNAVSFLNNDCKLVRAWRLGTAWTRCRHRMGSAQAPHAGVHFHLGS